MLVTGVELEEIREIVAKVSAREYGGHLDVRTSADLRGKRAPRCRFTLQLRGKYERGEPWRWMYRGDGSVRHRAIQGACWHAHRDVLTELFKKHPDARVKTALADYRGREDFERKFPATWGQNIGSAFLPLKVGEGCNCP